MTDVQAEKCKINAQDAIISTALKIIAERLKEPGESVTSPILVAKYLILRLATEEREIFGALWLDVHNRVISCDDMFFGSLTSVNVHPREVVKDALRHNAATVIFFHNHPSGVAAPSAADERITDALRAVLNLIDVKVLDHIIVGGTKTYSFAESGKI